MLYLICVGCGFLIREYESLGIVECPFCGCELQETEKGSKRGED